MPEKQGRIHGHHCGWAGAVMIKAEQAFGVSAAMHKPSVGTKKLSLPDEKTIQLTDRQT